MEPHELNRMFDHLAPTPEQEEEGLRRLLQTERKVTPMRKLKKLTVAGIAAALLLISCAAAVVTGIDQRLMDFMGWGEQAQELLAPGAVAVDVTAEDNGATLHISQVLMDRYSIMVLVDFTAPEGTVLDEDSGERYVFNEPWNLRAPRVPSILTKEKEVPLDFVHAGYSTKVLDDGDPTDNHLTLLFDIGLRDGIQPDWEIEGLLFYAKGLYRYGSGIGSTVACAGDWSCRIPVTWQDIGWSVQPNQPVGQMNGSDITVKEIYLSPMTLQVYMESVPIESATRKTDWGGWYPASEHIILTTKDGKTIPLISVEGRYGGSMSVLCGWVWPREQRINFSLTEITDPTLLQGGTITLLLGDSGEEEFVIHLDNLTPVTE